MNPGGNDGNITWELTSDGELIIEGTGAMNDYASPTYAPWYEHRSSITKVTIEEGVTSIGGSAFSDCSSLTTIVLPQSVTYIGIEAFAYCPKLTDVYAERVPGTETSAFTNSNLQNATLHVPANVLNYFKGHTTWGRFGNFETRTIVVISGNYGNITWKLTSDGELIIEGTGAMYNYGDPTYVPWYEHRSSITKVTIEEGVTSIGNYAFYDCSNLTTITIPESVTSIGLYAFGSCSSLAAINIPEGVTSIGNETFYGCSSLEAITIPENSQLTSIEYAAFSGCSSLTTIILPESMTSIGDAAFEHCSNLTSINIPESVTSIEYGAFYGCSSLTSINLPDNSQLASIEADAFYGTAWYDNQPDGVVYAGKVLYKYKGTMPENTSIEIKEGTKAITGSAFYGCSSLTSITLPEGVTSIGNYAFYGCSSLTAISIPESVTSIGQSAFYKCSSLTAITIPESVTSIRDWTFYGCSSLTSITLPEGLTSIESSAFYDCSRLYKVINCSNLSLSVGSTSYGHVAYYAKKIYQGGGLAIVDDFQFYTSNGIHYLVNYIGNDTDIVFPNNYNGENYKIGDYAFYGCSSLTTINIPESVTSIEKYAFSGCSSLTTINIPESVTSIGEDAFYNCSSLTSITIPEGVTSIGSSVFYGCSSLTAVRISSIGAWCNISFSGSNSNPLYYAKNLYLNGELVTDLTIPEGVTSIRDYAFSDCSSLTSLTIPESVTSIGRNAFQYCDGLTTINIPESVTSIGNAAFYYCSSLKNMNIPKNSQLTSIGSSTFRYCSNLTTISIPESVTSIENYAFSNCSSLTDVYCYAEEVPTTNTYAFPSLSIKNATLHVPANALANYKAEVPWSGFGTIVHIVVKVNSIALNSSSVSLCIGETTSLSAAIMPTDATDQSVSWSSSDESVATVDANGMITALTEGAATITATANDGSGVSAQCEVTVEAAIYVAINQYGSATYCSEYALDFSEVEGLKAYAATGYKTSTGIVTLTRVMTSQPGMGLFLKGEPGDEYAVPILESTDENSLNMLVGTLESTPVNGTSDDGLYYNYRYTIHDGDAEPMFYRVDDGYKLGAGKAYLQIPVAWMPAEAKAIAMRFDDGGTTDIEDIESGIQHSELIYDLMGRKVTHPQKGVVYIVNGKKVVIK